MLLSLLFRLSLLPLLLLLPAALQASYAYDAEPPCVAFAGTDIAIEAADFVLMRANLQVPPHLALRASFPHSVIFHPCQHSAETYRAS